MKQIGTSWDRNNRNIMNENFTEAERKVLEQKQRVDRLIQDAPQPSEVVDARGEHAVLGDRLNDFAAQLAQREQEILNLESKKANQSDLDTTNQNLSDTTNLANEANAKASNPLAALSVAGYKIPLEDLSTEVIEAMTGNTGVTTAKGYIENNRGVEYPLKNIVRDGQIWTVTQEVKDVVLDAKVINAREGKVYTLAYVANGYNGSYGVTIFEYDKDTFATDSSLSEKRLVWYFDTPLSAPTENVVTRTITKEGITFVITVDYSKITSAGGVGLNIADNTSGRGRGLIIDESNYSIFAQGQELFSLPLACKKDGDTISIKFAYSETHNMIIEFDKLGINEVIHLKRVFLKQKTRGTLDLSFANATLLYEAGSDWLSPYRIEAINNGNGNTMFTTGGNHGTDGGGGFPTARSIETQVFADDKELVDGEATYVKDKVVIQTINHVTAFNAIDLTTGTMRDSLKEIVTYTITPKNIGVTLEFEALEDLIVRNYSGLQAQKGAWAGLLYYFEDVGNPITFDISGTLTGESSTKLNGQPDRWVMKKDGNNVIAYYDTAIGLGTREYVDDDQVLFWHTGTKIYGKLLYNANGVTMNQGDSFYWSGGYGFTPGLECEGAETAYTYYLAGKKVYVVDFFNAANTYLKVDPNDINKKINVLEKSDAITCDSFISSKGLKIDSTGYGQLKFEII